MQTCDMFKYLHVTGDLLICSDIRYVLIYFGNSRILCYNQVTAVSTFKSQQSKFSSQNHISMQAFRREKS